MGKIFEFTHGWIIIVIIVLYELSKCLFAVVWCETTAGQCIELEKKNLMRTDMPQEWIMTFSGNE